MRNMPTKFCIPQPPHQQHARTHLAKHDQNTKTPKHQNTNYGQVRSGQMRSRKTVGQMRICLVKCGSAKYGHDRQTPPAKTSASAWLKSLRKAVPEQVRQVRKARPCLAGPRCLCMWVAIPRTPPSLDISFVQPPRPVWRQPKEIGHVLHDFFEDLSSPDLGTATPLATTE